VINVINVLLSVAIDEAYDEVYDGAQEAYNMMTNVTMPRLAYEASYKAYEVTRMALALAYETYEATYEDHEAYDRVVSAVAVVRNVLQYDV
jgi:hypothetical protein